MKKKVIGRKTWNKKEIKFIQPYDVFFEKKDFYF